ncbi:hypothetical protein Trydic_g12398 [Trypoxylus dichotomus]
MSKLAVFLQFLTAYATAFFTQSMTDQRIYHAASFRIVGGTVAPAGAYPFMVSLRQYPNKHFCGGTIVNNLWILTAGHCMEKKSIATVFAVVGTNKLNFGGIILKLHKIVFHPSYDDRDPTADDIAMIRLRFPLRYSATIAPVTLDTVLLQSIINVTLIGWGETTYNGSLSNNLLELSTQTLSHAACKLYWPYVFNEDHICTKFETGKGHCAGDSGGPLLYTDSKTQVGVISLRYRRGCGEMFPDVFGKVSSYVPWIQMIINTQS